MVLDLEDRELDAVVAKGRPALGEAAQGVEGQAADGQEVFLGRQVQVEAVVEDLERERRVDLEPRAAQRL